MMFGEARSGSLGSQGFAGHATVERGEAGQSTVGQGSRGLARRGELQYVAVNRGMAGRVKAVMSRFGFVWCGVAVWVRRVAFWNGAEWSGSHGMENHQLSERRQYASIYKQVFISQRL